MSVFFDGEAGRLAASASFHVYRPQDTPPPAPLAGRPVLLRPEPGPQLDLPSWLDVEAFARAYTGLMDGLLLQRLEAGDDHRPEEALRRARTVLDVLLAAGRAERGEAASE